MSKARKVLESTRKLSDKIHKLEELRDDTATLFCKKFKSIGALTNFDDVSAEYKIYKQDFSQKVGQVRQEFLEVLWDELTKAKLRIKTSNTGIIIQTFQRSFLPAVLQSVVFLNVSANHEGLIIEISTELDVVISSYPEVADEEEVIQYATDLLKITDILIKILRLI